MSFASLPTAVLHDHILSHLDVHSLKALISSSKTTALSLNIPLDDLDFHRYFCRLHDDLPLLRFGAHPESLRGITENIKYSNGRRKVCGNDGCGALICSTPDDESNFDARHYCWSCVTDLCCACLQQPEEDDEHSNCPRCEVHGFWLHNFCSDCSAPVCILCDGNSGTGAVAIALLLAGVTDGSGLARKKMPYCFECNEGVCRDCQERTGRLGACTNHPAQDGWDFVTAVHCVNGACSEGLGCEGNDGPLALDFWPDE
jgi:hypothetical protein